MHKPINFHPLTNNILDFIGKTLFTPNGMEVTITMPLTTFQVFFNGQMVYESGDNLMVSYFLNQKEVGTISNYKLGVIR